MDLLDAIVIASVLSTLCVLAAVRLSGRPDDADDQALRQVLDAGFIPPDEGPSHVDKYTANGTRPE